MASRYDELANDELEYLELVTTVARQISAGPSRTISLNTLSNIFTWLKPAILAWHFVQVDRFDQLYAPALRHACLPLPKGTAPAARLREIRATAEVLHKGGGIPSKNLSVDNYVRVCAAVEHINQALAADPSSIPRCRKRSISVCSCGRLRKIDRALIAYNALSE